MIKRILKLLALILIKIYPIFGQQQRDCECLQKYSIGSYQFSNLTRRYLKNVQDRLDFCDYKCVDWCAEQIRNSTGGSTNLVTELARENICETVAPNRSVYKDGIRIYFDWDLRGCTSNQQTISSNICCRHCECKIEYSERNGSNLSRQIIDLTDSILRLYSFKRSFECDSIDYINQCENDCRNFVSDYISYNITSKFSENSFDIIENRNNSDKMCLNLNQTVNSPGFDIKVKIFSGPSEKYWHKDIRLGNICCKRTCNCDVYYKTIVTNRTTIKFHKNINYLLPNRTMSYYCQDELKECIDDCKIAAGIFLNNTQIQNTDLSVLDIDIFSNFVTARKACFLYKNNAFKPDGINVYLRYSTGTGSKQLYPYSQDLFLGNVCCEPYFGIDWFPFNKCKMWNLADIPQDLEDK